MKKRIMFDNCAVNTIAENIEFYERLKEKYEFCVCTEVVNELARMPDQSKDPNVNGKEKRVQVFLNFTRLEMKFLFNSVFVLGHSRLDGFSRLTSDESAKVFNDLRNENRSNISDAIIGSTSVAEGCILLTTDRKFCNKMKFFGYPAQYFEEFKRQNG